MKPDLQSLRSKALQAQALRGKRWELQTSNSFRRIGSAGDGDVLCGTSHPHDGHPDLLARTEVLEYIVAAQPNVLLDLLDQLESFHVDLEKTRALVEAYAKGQTP